MPDALPPRLRTPFPSNPMSSSYTIPIAITVGGLIIAGAIYFALGGPSDERTGNPSLVRPVDSSDHILGNPSAKIMIIEYADYDCTFCKDFQTAMLRVIAERGADGSVAWVYRQFPLTELHENAYKHAQAAECVAKTGGNDAFWKFSHALFKKQPTDPSHYGSLALEAGAPTAAFQECYQNAVTLVEARIQADRQNALDLGAVGAPFSLILVSGKQPIVMDGAYTADAIGLLIDQALQK